MKRIFIISSLVLLLFLGSCSQTEHFCEECDSKITIIANYCPNCGTELIEGNYTKGLEYQLLPDNTYGVMAGKAAYQVEIVIPSEHNGKPVTRLLPNFMECDSPGSNYLQKVIIPSTITHIDRVAFQRCSSLKEIVFEGTVAQWNSIEFGDSWYWLTNVTEVKCSNGIVALD